MGKERFVWEPDQNTIDSSRLKAFQEQFGLSDYTALGDRAVQDPDWFYDAVIQFFDIRFNVPNERILDLQDGKPWPVWCRGGQTNLSENCLDRHIEAGRGEDIAIIWEGENGDARNWTYADLYRETVRAAHGLRQLGLAKGDVVGIYMPMIPEVAAAFLAIARIGAIALPLFSGFGPVAVASRLNDAGARAVITADGTTRRGKIIEMKTAVDLAADKVRSLQHVVVVPRLGIRVPYRKGRDIDWATLTDDMPLDPRPAAVMAEDPVMIIYTSGTTGRPKGTVHTHCGVIIKNALDLGLLLDIGRSDRLLWMSDMGWLVGPKTVVGATLLGATLILVEGTPDYPDGGRLWRLVDEQGATVVGLAPTVARGFMARDAEFVRKHDRSSIRILVSTGELWDQESWSWLFHQVGDGKRPILNYAGGTEIGGAILIGTLLHPLKPCSFGGPVPGTGAAIFNDKGDRVPVHTKGELVMEQTSIGLTRGLWKDRERYLETYWSRFPGRWVQGDLASIDEDGLWYLHGRGDDTIKIAGKRTGPGEVEQLLLGTGLVSEAAAVGVPHSITGQALVCACILRAGRPRPPELPGQLSAAVADGLGKAFRPQEIVFVEDLPRTRNQKIMRRVVRALYTGEDPGDISALANEEVLETLRTSFEASKRASLATGE